MNDRLFLIDLTNLIYRFFFAFIKNPLRNSAGFNTSAIFGVSNFLKETIKEYNIKYISCAVDLKKSTFRHELYKDYKSGRQETPDELISQLSYIYQIVENMGISLISKEGYEADDVIGTLARKFHDDFSEIFIVTSDKDMGQLIDEKTFIMYPKKENGKYPIIDTLEIEKRLGVKKEQIIDYYALTGDAVDGVPGIEGIGPVTAVKILSQVSSIEDLSDIDKINNEKIKDKLKNKFDDLKLFKKLIKIECNADIEIEKTGLGINISDNAKLNELFKSFELYSFVTAGEMLLKSDDNHKEIKTAENLEELCKNSETVLIFNFEDEIMIAGGDYIFKTKDKSVVSESIDMFFGKNIVTDSIKNHRELHSLIGKTEVFDISLFRQMNGRTFSIERVVREYNNDALDLSDNTLLTKEFYKVMQKFVSEVKNSKNYDVYKNIELPIIPAICEMERNGIKTDKKYFIEEREIISKKIKEKEDDIYKTAGMKFNINSPKQVADVLFDKLKIKPQRKTKTGYSTDQSVLESLVNFHPIAGELLFHREMTKLLSGFIEPIIQLTSDSERIHTTFEQSYAATGRFSSRNPNMQNVPNDVRRGFIPSEPDMRFLSIDYSQIELRVLALLSKDEHLNAAFAEGKDIHNQTAMYIFGIDENIITDRMRSIAKVVNFSVLYGKTPYGLSQELHIPRNEAEKFISAYFDEYSQVRDWIENAKEYARKNRYSTTYYGRVREIPEINSPNKNVREQAERIAVNTPIQGTAADIIKIAIKNVFNLIEGKNDIKLLLTIHDELLFELKNESVYKYLPEIESSMIYIEPFDKILKVKSKTGSTWGSV